MPEQSPVNEKPVPPKTEEILKKEVALDKLEVKENKNWVKLGSLVLSAIFIIAGGVLTGSWLAGQKGLFGSTGGKPKIIKTDKVVGSTDTKTFRDSTEGVLEKGGLDGEGTHHLVRPGGESQTAYLTSSVIDLDLYVGKKVKVYGETFQGQKAGWLMDVGKIELLD